MQNYYGKQNSLSSFSRKKIVQNYSRGNCSPTPRVSSWVLDDGRILESPAGRKIP